MNTILCYQQILRSLLVVPALRTCSTFSRFSYELEQGLDVDHAHHSACCVAAVSQPEHGWSVRIGRHGPNLLSSPREPRKVIWGFGPAFTIPTATNDILGQGKLSLGPPFVALAQPGHWTLGALVNNVWSIAGPQGRPAVNQMLLRYFITYQLKKGWYITSAPINTLNWKASSGSVRTVPVGGGVGRVTKLGFQPVNIAAQFYGNAVYPAGGSSWSICLQNCFPVPEAL